MVAAGASNGAAEPFTRLVDARPAAAPSQPPAVRVRETPSPPGPDGRPRAPRREVEVAIDGYPGFTAWIWANFPVRLAAAADAAIAAGDQGALVAFLRRIVVEHNGWCDDAGAPFPPADEVAFYDAIPLELAMLLLRAIQRAQQHYPQSLSPIGGR